MRLSLQLSDPDSLSGGFSHPILLLMGLESLSRCKASNNCLCTVYRFLEGRSEYEEFNNRGLVPRQNAVGPWPRRLQCGENTESRCPRQQPKATAKTLTFLGPTLAERSHPPDTVYPVQGAISVPLGSTCR